MNNRTLIITWKPDVLSMVQHDGSKHTFDKGLTSRSERETFRNIKSELAAKKIVGKRNKKEILFAQWEDEVIYTSN